MERQLAEGSMENDNLVSGLIHVRKEIAGLIEDAQLKMHQLIIDLDNIDATIRLFRSDLDLEEIRRSPLPLRHSAYKGEMSRHVLSALRDDGRAMTPTELAFHVMAECGLNVHDKRLVKLIGKRIGACLKHYKHKGALRSRKEPGAFLLWAIVRKVGIRGLPAIGEDQVLWGLGGDAASRFIIWSTSSDSGRTPAAPPAGGTS